MAQLPQEHSGYEIFFEAVKSVAIYIATGFVTIFTMFFLWVFGRYKTQHELMYSVYLDNTGSSAKQLNDKMEEEERFYRESVKNLRKRIVELEEGFQGVEEKIVQMYAKTEALIIHKDNNREISTRAILELLMEIQDYLKDKSNGKIN